MGQEQGTRAASKAFASGRAMRGRVTRREWRKHLLPCHHAARAPHAHVPTCTHTARRSLLAGFMRDGRLRRSEEVLSTGVLLGGVVGLASLRVCVVVGGGGGGEGAEGVEHARALGAGVVWKGRQGDLAVHEGQEGMRNHTQGSGRGGGRVGIEVGCGPQAPP